MDIPSYLINAHYEDRYFDVVNAIEEAKHIYFRGCDIIERLSAMKPDQRVFTIGELGFGTGRVLVSLMDFLEQNGIKDTTIIYHSVELHPITSERMASILEGFRTQVGSQIDTLVQAYNDLDLSQLGWHQLELKQPFGSLILNLWIGEALEMVQALSTSCHAWFLDGHGPKKNPSMWRSELLKAIGLKTYPRGTCATYTVAVAVRKDLTEAGFTVALRPGFGGKKSVLKGVMAPTY